MLVISISGNVIQYVANQNRVKELNTALVTSQSQLEAVTNELAELKPKLVQLEHDFSLLYTDYSKLELELSNPEPIPDQTGGSQGQQQTGGQQQTSSQGQTSKPNSETQPQGGKPQPSTEQQQQQAGGTGEIEYGPDSMFKPGGSQQASDEFNEGTGEKGGGFDFQFTTEDALHGWQ